MGSCYVTVKRIRRHSRIHFLFICRQHRKYNVSNVEWIIVFKQETTSDQSSLASAILIAEGVFSAPLEGLKGSKSNSVMPRPRPGLVHDLVEAKLR